MVQPRPEYQNILSDNIKTTLALNFPIINCRPTCVCGDTCYSCQGQQNFKQGIKMSLQVHKAILDDPIGAADRVAKEARGRLIRTSGSGEIGDQKQYKTFFKQLKRNKVRLFGFTRKPEVYLWMKKLGYPLMFSLDAGTKKKDIEFVKKHVRIKARAWLSTPEDPEPSFPVMVTFPQHGPQTMLYKKMKRLKTDCPAVRDKLHCDACKVCYLGNDAI